MKFPRWKNIKKHLRLPTLNKKKSLIVLVCSLLISAAIYGAAGVGIGQMQEQALFDYASNKVLRIMGRVTFPDGSSGGWGGTGFFVKRDNGSVFMITNSHVCSPFKNAYLINGAWTRMRVVRIDFKNDICALLPLDKGSWGDIPAFTLAKSNSSELDVVYVVGHPSMRDLTLTIGHKFYVGEDIIPIAPRAVMTDNYGDSSCIAPSMEPPESMQDALMQVIFSVFCVVERTSFRFTAAIEPGSSGSPILNWRGQVVGAVWGYNPGEHMGLGVPLSAIRGLVNGVGE